MTREEVLIEMQADGARMIRDWLSSLDDHQLEIVFEKFAIDAAASLDSPATTRHDALERFKIMCTCVILQTELVSRMNERKAATT